MIMDKIVYWLALKAVRGVGNRLFLRLLERFESPENVFKAPKSALLAVEGVGRGVASSIVGQGPSEEVIKDLKLVEENGASILTFSDPCYPILLREIHDPPLFFMSLATCGQTV